MKKFLSLKPAVTTLFLTATLSVLFFNAAIAFELKSDTAYYYNERGKLLWLNTHATKQESFVIKTRKKFAQIFHELKDDTSVTISSFYAAAAVANISRRTSKKTERLIQKGLLNDPLVTQNIIPVLDKTILRRMYDNIQSRCNSSGSKEFKEHGGVLLPDGTITCITGDISDPRWFAGATLFIKQQALVYYHSHPCGCVEKNSHEPHTSVAERNPNRVSFSSANTTEWICYIQGPSKQDQEAVGNGVGYVFGMNGNSALIYIYDREGVKATLPISFVKKVRKPGSQKDRKIETYTAGRPGIQLPYLF